MVLKVVEVEPRSVVKWPTLRQTVSTRFTDVLFNS